MPVLCQVDGVLREYAEMLTNSKGHKGLNADSPACKAPRTLGAAVEGPYAHPYKRRLFTQIPRAEQRSEIQGPLVLQVQQSYGMDRPHFQVSPELIACVVLQIWSPLEASNRPDLVPPHFD